MARQPKNGHGPDGRPRTWLHHLGSLGFVGLVMGSALVLSARFFWLGEIAASFTWQLGWVAALGGLLLGICRRIKLGAVALALCAMHLAPDLCLWLPDSRNGEPDLDGPQLTIASCNLQWGNHELEGIRAWIRESEADVIAFQELAPGRIEFIQSLSDEYPSIFFSPELGLWKEDTMGTAFLTRLPPVSSRLLTGPGDPNRAPRETTLPWGAATLVLRSVHVPRPGRPWRMKNRQEVFERLLEQDWGTDSILLGDLNLTSSSPLFARLLDQTNLRDSRAGFGRQPSFTTGAPIPGLEIAIDHVLVSPAIHVLDRRVVDLPGSDHAGVIIRIGTIKPWN